MPDTPIYDLDEAKVIGAFLDPVVPAKIYTSTWTCCEHKSLLKLTIPRVKLWRVWIGSEEIKVCRRCKQINPIIFNEKQNALLKT